MAKTALERQQDIRVLREFIAAAEKAKIMVPVPLKAAVAAFDTSNDIGVAFENVCNDLDKFYKDMDASLARKYDMTDMQQQDEAYIEMAKNFNPDRDAVRFVLAANYDKSMVNQLWGMWRPKIAAVLRDRSKNIITEFLKKAVGSE